MPLSIFLILLFSCFNLFADSKDQIKKNLPTVAIITTGGTISMNVDPQTGALVPAKSSDFFSNIPLLKEIANIKHVDFSNIDSSQMTPELWAKLSQVVDETLKDKDIVGAVVTHGTDTMAEGSYFLDLTLRTQKPVVFTGAMRGASDPYPDGPFNLINAVYQVVAKNAGNWGVTVTMNEYILSSRDVEKTHTTNPQAFFAGEKGYLGYIFNGKVERFNDRLYRPKFSIPKTLPKVEIFYDYAGVGGEYLKFLADSGPAGIVIESLGSGNVNEPVFAAVKYALEKGIIIVITTSVPYGGVFPVYGDIGGGAVLKKEGVIISRHLRAAKARLLLMLAIGKHGRENLQDIAKVFAQP